MKKIVFKIPEFPHLSETFIVAQIVTAIKLGYEVQILTRRMIKTEESQISSRILKYKLLDKTIVENYEIPQNKILRLLKWLLLIIKNLKFLKAVLKYHSQFSKFSLTWLYQLFFYKQFNNAYAIHVQYGTNVHPLDILKKVGFLKPSLIVTFHGHDVFFPISRRIHNNGYYDKLFSFGNLITANTPYLGNKILELGCPNKLLRLIPVGVDTDFFYPIHSKKNRKKTLRLITVGRLEEVKGHKYCIEVVDTLVKKGYKIELTIIGEGTERGNLQGLIKKYQLEKYVYLLGAKSQEEIRNELCKHDVYLLLSVISFNGLRESQGLATLEAQACGLPVIVFDSGGVKYTLKEAVTGFICDEYDTEEVSLKVKEFINNPTKLDEMSDNAVEFVRNNFSQQVLDEKWRIIYQELRHG